ncbi:MAG: 1-deoxy-D-xylulose-5-phosphate synthase [Clostridia bacterium]|nr:1-deoxy-D-xylulose-5-phosphate synthase [Clostridia bacterium]
MKQTYPLLESIHSPKDFRSWNDAALQKLATEIRGKIIETTLCNGGHLASNLGMVECTIALHKVFQMPEDSLVFDVGHQTYAHKLLTGRYSEFSSLRRMGGLSGFPEPSKTLYDAFGTGHSSTSVSAALGIAVAKRLQGQEGTSVAVIGDGALGGGLAFEGLNNAGRSGERLIVVLNDNEMSISQNVGALAKSLAKLRGKKGYLQAKRATEQFLLKIPKVGNSLYKGIKSFKNGLKRWVYGKSSLFSELGFTYLGPCNGHNIQEMCVLMEHAKRLNKPVLLHILTVKGKGMQEAEEAPQRYHSVSPSPSKEDFSFRAGQWLCKQGERDSGLVAITAAMTDGTGLSEFAARFPERFFDVGIAEEHAVTFGAALAKGGAHPYFAVYSTFLQRSYDQILHDVALQGCPLTLCIDRAGLVGSDGATHHGVFDVAMLSSVPHCTLYAPASYKELETALELCRQAPLLSAVRYPRGSQGAYQQDGMADTVSFWGDEDPRIVFLTYGTIINEVEAARKKLSFPSAVVKINRLIPLDAGTISGWLPHGVPCFFVEEGNYAGGVAQALQAALKRPIHVTAIEDGFVPHGSVAELWELCGFSAEKIAQKAKEIVENAH